MNEVLMYAVMFFGCIGLIGGLLLGSTEEERATLALVGLVIGIIIPVFIFYAGALIFFFLLGAGILAAMSSG